MTIRVCLEKIPNFSLLELIELGGREGGREVGTEGGRLGSEVGRGRACKREAIEGERERRKSQARHMAF